MNDDPGTPLTSEERALLQGEEGHAPAAARLWTELEELNQARKERRVIGRDFEDAEFDLNRQMLDLVFHRAEELWPRSIAKAWMGASNEHLNGARPYQALRERGPAEVLAALELEAQRPLG